MRQDEHTLTSINNFLSLSMIKKKSTNNFFLSFGNLFSKYGNVVLVALSCCTVRNKLHDDVDVRKKKMLDKLRRV